jgi:sec-independent protein translocase protein TatA
VLAFIGPWEALLIVLILVYLFGGKRLVDAGRSLGRGAREFKREVTDEDDEKPRRFRAELPPAAAESPEREREEERERT